MFYKASIQLQFVEVLAADASRELYEEAFALEEIASQGQMEAVPPKGPQGEIGYRRCLDA